MTKSEKSNPEKLIEVVPSLLNSRKFRSVVPTGKNNTFSKCRLSGAEVKWKKEPDFSYSYELRVVGPHDEVKDLINSLTSELISKLKEAHPEKNEHISTKKSLLDRVISFKNFATPSKLKNNPKELFEYEKVMIEQLKEEEREKLANAPTIAMYYEAFLKYKEELSKVEKGLVKTGGSDDRKNVKMDEIGKIYTGLNALEVLNVHKYGDVGGSATIQKLQDRYGKGKTEMFKVPGYKLISSRKKDIMVALKDLITLGAIELKKGKEFDAVVKSWVDVKNDKNANDYDEGPEELVTTKRTAPRTVNAKIRVKNH